MHLEPRSLPADANVARRRRGAAAVVYAVALANAGVIVWLWAHGGNLDARSTGDVFTSIGRLTGLLSAYLALLQVILLARLPALERAVGFDRLSVWHRWNGHACIDLVIAHVVFTVWGYALMDRFTIGEELWTMLGGGVYPGMVTATIGTVMLLGVVATSLVIVRRRLSYEWWYAVHLLAYAGIALSWFHEIPTGNELVLDRAAADYWRGLYLATIAILVVFRIGMPLVQLLRHRLRVVDVTEEAPGVVSLRIVGRQLDRLRAEPGQFFLWRFLDRRRIWSAHPFSLSAAPDGKSLRVTVKALGDHTDPPRRRASRNTGARGRPVRRVHRGGPAAAREGAADRRRHRDHADPVDGRADARRRRRHLPRADATATWSSSASSTTSRRGTASSSTTWSATITATAPAFSPPSTCASSYRTPPTETSSFAARRR